MTYETILFENKENNVAHIILNRPKSKNAINPKMLTELTEVVSLLKAPSSNYRALLLSAQGNAFCSGADLKQPFTESNFGTVLRRYYNPFFSLLKSLDFPIVVAVNGVATGIGMSLAIMGDIVYASKNAFFMQGFSKIGLVPDGGSTFLLPRLIGLRRAVELSLLSEPLSAPTAMDWGLISKVYENEEQLDQAALKAANAIALGPKSLGLTRSLCWQSLQNSWDEQLDLEADYQQIASQTEDFQEGVCSFIEKRPPSFKGK